VKNRAGERAMVWAGTGSNNTESTIKLSREAEKTGVNGIMLVVPYYNKPSQEGLYQHFKKIAESVSLPVMLYNIPGRTNCNMLPDTVARLAAVENIVAIKESSGDMDQMSLLHDCLKGKITVYSGDDSLTLPMMALGAHGVVSIASHLVGNRIKAMIDAFVAGNNDEARALHNMLFPIFKGLFVTTNPVPLKEALNMMGMEVGGLRLPLCTAGEKEKLFIKELLLKYDLLK
ncbi:MAG: 4-hydroxy-tetrahydrodipicolinate synthase, partial [Syntrophomonadaceae bacterium]|nr:4-hydroxy-tetrahydrodipicolinate synthase [Syntrophomonadaceae bacterium]